MVGNRYKSIVAKEAAQWYTLKRGIGNACGRLQRRPGEVAPGRNRDTPNRFS